MSEPRPHAAPPAWAVFSCEKGETTDGHGYVQIRSKNKSAHLSKVFSCDSIFLISVYLCSSVAKFFAGSVVKPIL